MAVLMKQQIDSILGTWSQISWKPDRGDMLNGLVDMVWDFEGTIDSFYERVFPNARLELVIQLDEPHRRISARGIESFPAVCLDGLQTRPVSIAGPSGHFRVLGIRLQPGGAFMVCGGSLRDLTDQSLDFGSVIGSSARRLAERLADARNGTDRVAIAMSWVRTRVTQGPQRDPLVAAAQHAIERSGGAASIAMLDELCGRSRSRFAALFVDSIGVTPKRYSRIVRFSRALSMLDATQSSLLQIAADAGYYDQPHFNAEFREHAGLTPGAYQAGIRFPQSTHLAESPLQPAAHFS